MKKITFVVPEDIYLWIMSFVAVIETRLKVEIKPEIRDIREGTDAQPSRSRVKYVALGDATAIPDLGEKTIIGLIYAHLLANGPTTDREIRDTKYFNAHTIQASLQKLKQMGLVGVEEIE